MMWPISWDIDCCRLLVVLFFSFLRFILFLFCSVLLSELSTWQLLTTAK